MADANLRALELALKKDLDNVELLKQYAVARARSGMKDEKCWRIKHESGKFLGNSKSSYNSKYRQYEYTPRFTATGIIFKTEKDAEDTLINFITSGHTEEIKKCSILEYRTVVIDEVPLKEKLDEIHTKMLKDRKAKLEADIQRLEASKLAEIESLNKRIEAQKTETLKEAQKIERKLEKRIKDTDVTL